MLFPLRHYSVFLLFVVLIFFTGFRSEAPKVLIIGDSISIGYFPYVQEQLTNATVIHNPGNAQHTGTGLKKLNEWLGDEQWDVIHFNWGLWDLCYRHPDATTYGNRDKIRGTVTFTPEVYGQNLEALVKRLKRTDAKLIFATTTYVPPGEAGRFEKDAKRYNAIAKRIMRQNAVPVNNLFPISKKVHQQHKRAEGDVHFTKEGSEILAQKVSQQIQKALKRKK